MVDVAAMDMRAPLSMRKLKQIVLGESDVAVWNSTSVCEFLSLNTVLFISPTLNIV